MRCLGRVPQSVSQLGLRARLGLLALLVCATAPAKTANAAPQSDHERFEAWAAKRASALKGRVSVLMEVELDGQPGAEFVARVCQDKGAKETVLVERDGQRWEVPHASQSKTRVCTVPKRRPAWDSDKDALVLTDVGPDSMSERRLVIVGDKLAVTSEQRADPTQNVEVRWDLASQRRPRGEGRVVAVREGNLAPAEPGPVFVRRGKSHWTGHADADVLTVAERRSDGSLILRLKLRDDEHVGGLSGDRVQVWWADPQTEALRGVDVRAGANGRLRAIALRTQQLPPTVHGSIHELEIVLPWAAATGEVASVPLTVVAFDVDTDGTTVLATSQFTGQTESLGQLRYVPGGGTFETTGRRVPDASSLNDLPPPPR